MPERADPHLLQMKCFKRGEVIHRDSLDRYTVGWNVLLFLQDIIQNFTVESWCTMLDDIAR